MTTTTRHGFTLIELLVVVSIIAVLAGMLLPAIGMVKRAALKAKFSANLRQAGMAVMAYANDQNGITPPYLWISSADTWGGTVLTRNWQQLVQPYLDGEETPGSPNGFASNAQAIIYQSDHAVLRSVLHDPADAVKYPLSSPPRYTRSVAINGSDKYNDGWVAGDRVGGATNRALGTIGHSSELLLLGPGRTAALAVEWDDGGRYRTNSMRASYKPAEYGRYGSSIPLCMADLHVESMSLTAFWEQATIDDTTHLSRLFDRLQTNP